MYISEFVMPLITLGASYLIVCLYGLEGAVSTCCWCWNDGLIHQRCNVQPSYTRILSNAAAQMQ